MTSEWPAELDAEYRKLCEELVAKMTAAPADQQAKWKEDYANMKAAYAGEQKAELQGELFATFQACDTNQTGLLNEAQLIDFYKKAHANHVARGWTALEIQEDQIKAAYGILNKLTAGADGVSMMDIANQTQKKADIMKELTGEEKWGTKISTREQ